MKKTDKEQPAGNINLLPHQASLLEMYFDPSCKRVMLLHSDVGLGKMQALEMLMHQVVQKDPDAHVLLIAPNLLTYQYAQHLNDSENIGFRIDSYSFREMIDIELVPEIWLEGKVVIANPDFIKKPDVQQHFSRYHWNLVIVDEAHNISGLRCQAIQKLIVNADRVVLATYRNNKISVELTGNDYTLVEWNRETAVNASGTLLFNAPRPKLHKVQFSPTEGEKTVERALLNLIKALYDYMEIRNPDTNLLNECLMSSPVALEETLQRVFHMMLGNTSENTLTFTEDANSWESYFDDKISGHIPNQVNTSLHSTFDAIENLTDDSKLSSFSDLVSSLIASNDGTSIYALARYTSTTFYLSSELEGKGIPCVVVHNEDDEIESRINISTKHKGITITVATFASIEGIDKIDADNLILYDLPGNIDLVQRTIGKFDREGRTGQLNIYVMNPLDPTNDEGNGTYTVLKQLYEQ